MLQWKELASTCVNIIIMIYSYRLYPVDKSRTNEFGESFKPKEHKD